LPNLGTSLGVSKHAYQMRIDVLSLKAHLESLYLMNCSSRRAITSDDVHVDGHDQNTTALEM
jgi:hypothetical protein